MKTVTFDETKWQVVPKKSTDAMFGAWNDCCGGFDAAYKALLAADPEAPAAEPVNARLLASTKSVLGWFIGYDHTDGYCCCGSPMEDHASPLSCGHVAIDAGIYHSNLIIEEAEKAIAAAEQQSQQCRCTMAQRMVGDGCDVCNPELAAEIAAENASEQQASSK